MRFGLIGTGHWAATIHAPGIVSHPEVELVYDGRGQQRDSQPDVPCGLKQTVYWGEAGVARMPQDVDVAAAYAGAIDALLDGQTPFDATFGREVVRILASAEEAGTQRRPPPSPAAT